jgi:hypothetical protein
MYVHTRQTRPILLAKLVEIKENKDVDLLFCQTCWPAPPHHGLYLLQTQYPLVRVRKRAHAHKHNHTQTHTRVPALSPIHAF